MRPPSSVTPVNAHSVNRDPPATGESMVLPSKRTRSYAPSISRSAESGNRDNPPANGKSAKLLGDFMAGFLS
jgi:hypothetical protein